MVFMYIADEALEYIGQCIFSSAIIPKYISGYYLFEIQSLCNSCCGSDITVVDV